MTQGALPSTPDLARILAESPREERAPAAPTEPPVKPSLRGVSHQLGFFVALVASAVLVARTSSGRPQLAALVFGASLVALLGTSAVYHRVDWKPEARMLVRRLDHAAIFVLIAGGYTPLFWLVPDADGGHAALALVWAGASLGIAKSLAWPRAPKWIMAALCVGLGWTVTGAVIARTPVVGALSVGCLVVSGAIYSSGALVYAAKRPNPWPRTFGYHEIFHALVLVASVCLFAHVALVLRAAG